MTDTRIVTLMDAYPGQSGSPIYTLSIQRNEVFVAGVYSAETAVANLAVRFSGHDLERAQESTCEPYGWSSTPPGGQPPPRPPRPPPGDGHRHSHAHPDGHGHDHSERQRDGDRDAYRHPNRHGDRVPHAPGRPETAFAYAAAERRLRWGTGGPSAVDAPGSPPPSPNSFTNSIATLLYRIWVDGLP
ncbi:MAG: hypothetical protein IPG47_14370 [Thermoflexaceae bacterium]|nr:hypothetical protein [Thermoflexaceae bacterium]